MVLICSQDTNCSSDGFCFAAMVVTHCLVSLFKFWLAFLQWLHLPYLMRSLVFALEIRLCCKGSNFWRLSHLLNIIFLIFSFSLILPYVSSKQHKITNAFLPFPSRGEVFKHIQAACLPLLVFNMLCFLHSIWWFSCNNKENHCLKFLKLLTSVVQFRTLLNQNLLILVHVLG